MAIRSVWLEFNLQCRSCGETLPVNCAAESILCIKCGAHTPTPEYLWAYLVTASLVKATGLEPGKESWAKGLHASIGSYGMTYGRSDPKCRECGAAWKIDDLRAIASGGAAKFTCGSCNKIATVRKPPEWFSRVVPDPVLLVGETATAGTVFKGETSVSIHCYHCGGGLQLDGSSRTVKCTFCGNDLLVPDDVWLRLHPVMTAHPWYIMVEMGDAVALIPDDISEVTDIALLPDGDAVLLFDSHEGACIGRTDQKGRFKWLIENLTITSDARLFYVGGAGLLWVVASNEEEVLSFDASTGDLAGDIRNEGQADTISVLAHVGAVALSDNTLVVFRGMPPDFPYRLRRYDSEGKSIPMWKGIEDRDLPGPGERPDWGAMPDRPLYPPDDALLEPGPEGTLYFIHKEKCIVSRYDPSGTHLGTVQAKQNAITQIHDCGVADDGTVFVVFEHKKMIGDDTWDHVGRMAPDGSFEILVGPHAPVHNFSIGTYGHKLSVTGPGSFLLCGTDFNELWAMQRDGSVIWKTPGTRVHDEDRADELAEAAGKKFMKKKKKD